MNTTDTSEGGLEALIVRHLVAANGYEQGANADYDKESAWTGVKNIACATFQCNIWGASVSRLAA